MPPNEELGKPGRPELPEYQASPELQALIKELLQKYLHADISGLREDLSKRFPNDPSTVRDTKIFQVIHELAGHCAQVCNEISQLKP